MRKDAYSGEQVPSTLGEYRDLCQVLGVPNNKAIAMLDKKIRLQGRDAEVIQADGQMRALLMPMMLETEA